jgi:thiosulfate dehydrogenase [quinone] large subunit
MNASDKTDTLALTYGALLARIWLGVRAIQTGLEKFAGTKVSEKVVDIDGAPNDYGLTSDGADKVYSMANYHGVPEALKTKFAEEPLMAGWALNIYDKVLGPALLVLGLTILLGIASRTSLFALGLLYISLTWGLILIKQDPGVAWLGTHMLIIIAALALHQHNRFCILKKW